VNRKIVSAIIILSIATASSAEYNTTPVYDLSHDKQDYFKKHLYIGVGVSPMRLLNDGTGEEFTANGMTIQAGIKYSKYLAIEARYTMNAGKIEYDAAGSGVNNADYPADFTNIAIYAKPMLPIDDFSIYALVGYGEVGITNLPIGDVDRAESGLQLGIGVKYSINKEVSVFMDYTSLYDGKGFDNLGVTKNHKASMVTFGTSYNF